MQLKLLLNNNYTIHAKNQSWGDFCKMETI
nr:MAG TPA: hypothetical protein [Bacteriophage sp.]